MSESARLFDCSVCVKVFSDGYSRFFFFLASFALLWGAAIAAVWLIRRWFLGRLNVSALLASSSDAIDALLDAKLELLVLLFKQQVPMASTFLVGPLVDRLKGEAHRELMTLLLLLD